MSEWKETRIGSIPKDWEIKTIGDIAELRQGLQISTSKRFPSYKQGRLPLLKITDLPTGNYSEYVEDIPENYVADENDIIYTRTGQVGLVYTDKTGAVHNNCFKVIVDNKFFDKYFIYYYLQSNSVKKYALSVASGSVQADLTHSAFKTCPIAFPPLLQEQKNIGYFLYNLDAKIENLRRQNETLEQIAQTLFKHWFIDFEFPNADGKPYKSSGGAMFASELGDIPEGWKVGKLGDVVSINSQSIDKNYPHKIIEYVDISSVGIGILENTTQYKLSEAPSRARRLVQHGDVIWSGVRPNRKSYLFMCKPIDNLVVSTGFIVLSPTKIPSSYLYAWVTTPMFVDYLTLNASGSAYPAVKAEHFEIAEIVLPSKLVLEKFHSLIDPMRIKNHQNSLQIQTLTKTRDSLLPKLMSGQLRVKE